MIIIILMLWLQQARVAALEKTNRDLSWQVAMLTRSIPSPGKALRGNPAGIPSEDALQDSTGMSSALPSYLSLHPADYAEDLLMYPGSFHRIMKQTSRIQHAVVLKHGQC